MKNLLSLLLFGPFAGFYSFAQAPDIIWQKCFGGMFGESAKEIKQTEMLPKQVNLGIIG